MEEKPEDLTIITSFKLFLLNFHEFPLTSSSQFAPESHDAWNITFLSIFSTFVSVVSLFRGKNSLRKIWVPVDSGPVIFLGARKCKDPREDPLGYGRAPNWFTLVICRFFKRIYTYPLILGIRISHYKDPGT